MKLWSKYSEQALDIRAAFNFVLLPTHEILALGLLFFVLLYREASTAPQIVGNLNDYIVDII